MSQTANPPQSSAPALAIRRALRRVDARLRSAASCRGLGTAALGGNWEGKLGRLASGEQSPKATRPEGEKVS